MAIIFGIQSKGGSSLEGILSISLALIFIISNFKILSKLSFRDNSAQGDLALFFSVFNHQKLTQQLYFLVCQSKLILQGIVVTTICQNQLLSASFILSIEGVSLILAIVIQPFTTKKRNVLFVANGLQVFTVQLSVVLRLHFANDEGRDIILSKLTQILLLLVSFYQTANCVYQFASRKFNCFQTKSSALSDKSNEIPWNNRENNYDANDFVSQNG